VLLVREILGARSAPEYAGRRVDPLLLDSTDATKRRLRATTAGGVDVALDLERGAYLFDGAVLDDDGERLVAVERATEEAMIVRFAAGLEPEALLEQALRLGHALGNQHVPIDVAEGELRVPVTTSREVLAGSVGRLGLAGVEVDFADVRLGRWTPLRAPGHEHP